MIDISNYFLYKFQKNFTKIKLFFHLCKAAFYIRLSLKFKLSLNVAGEVFKPLVHE